MSNDTYEQIYVDFTALPAQIAEGGLVKLTAEPPSDAEYEYQLQVDGVAVPLQDVKTDDDGTFHAAWDTTGRVPSVYTLHLRAQPKATGGAAAKYWSDGHGQRPEQQVVVTFRPVSRDETVPVTMRRAGTERTTDQILWVIIRNRTDALSFQRYSDFITDVMCNGRLPEKYGATPVKTPFTDVEAYNLLKVATELFVMHEVGVLKPDDVLAELSTTGNGEAAEDARAALSDEARRLGFPATPAALATMRDDYYRDLKTNGVVDRNALLPYLDTILQRLSDIPLKDPDVAPANCYGVLRSRLVGPLALELIWSYWMEEGGLVQTLNQIGLRFQNRRPSGRDPLNRFDLGPLRPLSNLLWGYVQDEPHRLSVARRAYEYDHHYGLRIAGKAVPELHASDSRSQFVNAFHSLLHHAALFYPQDDDTTVIADGFPILNALRETHLLLAEGAHNQYGDLPSTARVEMLQQQFLLARPEIKTYLGGREMVPYAEAWMDSVDTMRTLQGWNKASINQFRDLAVYGEQIVLSVRYGNWNLVNDPAQAANWARYWRPELQRYIHSYRTVTGVDLSAALDTRMPAVHLKRKESASVTVKATAASR